MAKANFKPLNLNDEVLSRMQSNIQQAFSNLDQSSGLSVVTVTSTYTLSASDDVVLADPARAAFIVVLPDPKTITKVLVLRKVGSSSNVVTVQPASPSIKVDGQATLALTTAQLVSDGSNYWVVG